METVIPSRLELVGYSESFVKITLLRPLTLGGEAENHYSFFRVLVRSFTLGPL
jgi:hypothetical protein